MKKSILCILILAVSTSWAQEKKEKVVPETKSSLEDLTLEYQFNEEMGIYKIWSVGDEYFITHLNTEESNPAPAPEKKAEEVKEEASAEPVQDKLIRVSQEKLDFIRSKVLEILKLKDVGNCEKRKISASFKIDNKAESKSGCLDGSDPLSQKLNQLSATLMILL